MTHTEPPDLPCNQFVELVTDYLDDAMTSDERARVDAHLAGCPYCADVLAQWQTVIAVAGALKEDEVGSIDPTLRASLMTAFRQARSG
jgi:anti-sigma factor RsiW